MIEIRLPKDKRMTRNRIGALVHFQKDTFNMCYIYLFLPNDRIDINGMVNCTEHLPDGSKIEIDYGIDYLVLHCLVHEYMHYVLRKVISEDACDKFDYIAPELVNEVMKECIL